MDMNLIKQAYAYGAALALQKLGCDPQQAEEGGIKLAEEAMYDDSEGSSVGPALGGAGLGALGGLALGAGSAFIPGLRGLGASRLAGKAGLGGLRAPQKLISSTAFRGAKSPDAKALRWAQGKLPNDLANSVQEAYIRGLGGAGAGALGGGLIGGLSD
jgi:hypothetical protein